METIEQTCDRLEKENATLRADLAGYIDRNKLDSEAFVRMRIHLGNAAKAAQAVVDLHAEHLSSGV